MGSAFLIRNSKFLVLKYFVHFIHVRLNKEVIVLDMSFIIMGIFLIGISCLIYGWQKQRKGVCWVGMFCILLVVFTFIWFITSDSM
ncbi:hypothetical protein BAU17_03635 [Enterococcus sp. CU12B]|uniref:Uncharacterized protein n=1 Tax=Candidatus Enterococcus willemsii TaxID=1857215 RepID=A0ABQ6Z0A6_9ENTE|nr:hypothetical protein BAU17_03635 [Enterococcus sp. CU12B]